MAGTLVVEVGTLVVEVDTLAVGAPRYTEVVVGMEATAVMEEHTEVGMEATVVAGHREVSAEVALCTVGVMFPAAVVVIPDLHIQAKGSSGVQPDSQERLNPKFRNSWVSVRQAQEKLERRPSEPLQEPWLWITFQVAGPHQ